MQPPDTAPTGQGPSPEQSDSASTSPSDPAQPSGSPQGVTSSVPTPTSGDHHRVSVFAALGGQQFFDHLVEHFYDLVAHDEILLPLYPDQVDLGPAKERLALFLAQYWGGPETYSQERGHPRLRMRHAPFQIGEVERDHWMAAMTSALGATIGESPLDPDQQAEVAQRMQDYFQLAADHMINT